MSQRISITQQRAMGGLTGLRSSASGNSLHDIAEAALAKAEKSHSKPKAARASQSKGEKVKAAVGRKTKPVKYPTEHQEQTELFKWAEDESERLPALKMLFAIPNGAGVNHQHSRNGTRFSLEGAKLKREGMKQGVPDVFLARPANGFHGLFIEMKRAKKSLSKTSPQQLAWHSALNAMGYQVVVCYGAEEVKAVILNYLGVE